MITMNTSKYLLTILFSFLLLSCSRDNSDDNAISESNFIGKWTATSLSLDGVATINGQSTKVQNTVPFGNCERQTLFIFNTDGTGYGEAWSSENGSCEIVKSGNFTYIYDKANRTITTNTDNVIEISKIVSISNNKLVAQQSVQNMQTSGITFSGTIQITYQKVSQ